MGKSAPAPPPAPDYAGAAVAQGQANIAAGQQTASLSNPNINNPYGSQTVTYGPTGPNGDMQPTINQTLTPQAQQALDAQQAVQTGLAGLSLKGLNSASNLLGTPFQYQGAGINTGVNIPGADASGVPHLNTGALQTGVNAPGINPNAPQFNGGLQTSPDMSGVASMPVGPGMTGQQAILSRLNPQIQQNEAATRQMLANQGITQGSEAWNNQMRTQGQQENDLYSQAGLYGLGLDMQANQQGYGQALSNAEFGNQAALQGFGAQQSAYGQGLGAQSQAFAQGLQNVGLTNQAAMSGYGSDLTAYQQALAAQQQGFGQNLAAGEFGNQAALQNYQQQLAQYNQPFNQITALMSGSQIQNPQFQQYSGANIQAAPIANATQQLGQFQQGLYGQQVAAYNAQMGAIGSALGAAGAAAGGGFFG